MCLDFEAALRGFAPCPQGSLPRSLEMEMASGLPSSFLTDLKKQVASLSLVGLRPFWPTLSDYER